MVNRFTYLTCHREQYWPELPNEHKYKQWNIANGITVYCNWYQKVVSYKVVGHHSTTKSRLGLAKYNWTASPRQSSMEKTGFGSQLIGTNEKIACTLVRSLIVSLSCTPVICLTRKTLQQLRIGKCTRKAFTSLLEQSPYNLIQVYSDIQGNYS